MTTMVELRSVVLAGGGTGGHIYPLLAFAECLRRYQPELRITCVGSAKGLEGRLIPAAGFELRQVPAYQLPRSVNLDLARTPARMLRSMKAGRAVLDDVEADVVVGFGGYVAVPAYLAAWRRHTPIVIHELNVPPGVANRLGMRFTKHVAVGFPYQPTVSPLLADARVVGVPLRPAIATLDRFASQLGAREHFGLDPHRPTLFVFGASQGARSINLAVSAAAKAITAAGIQVLHVTGARNEGIEVPPELPAPYVTLPYIADMELGYAAADLVLSRGGAMTLAEVTTVGLPAIYVPLPYGNGEQRRNALPVVQAGGGLLVDDAELTPEWIERTVIPLANDRPRLTEMGETAARYGRRDGDEALRAFVLDVVSGRV
jgi:UDP-N-acetylglucosamine--N-acetylmuramyl-(pentapeptide) pyrophosphoryl-undecaprenol N-acetylglucosamine transferase